MASIHSRMASSRSRAWPSERAGDSRREFRDRSPGTPRHPARCSATYGGLIIGRRSPGSTPGILFAGHVDLGPARSTTGREKEPPRTEAGNGRRAARGDGLMKLFYGWVIAVSYTHLRAHE